MSATALSAAVVTIEPVDEFKSMSPPVVVTPPSEVTVIVPLVLAVTLPIVVSTSTKANVPAVAVMEKFSSAVLAAVTVTLPVVTV